jgi:hypothetical protein
MVIHSYLYGVRVLVFGCSGPLLINLNHQLSNKNMTQEQFIYWLRGFISGKNYICTQDIDLLKEELAKVTVITYTPPPYTWPGATWGGVDTASSQSSYVPSSHPSCHDSSITVAAAAELLKVTSRTN